MRGRATVAEREARRAARAARPAARDARRRKAVVAEDVENVVAETAIGIAAWSAKAAVTTIVTAIEAEVRNGGTDREMEVGALLLAINTTTKAVTPCAFEIQA